ncbi:branched-chain amino acid aminotransferase [Streptomyces sp. NRRL F-4489]|uniref:ScbR family autoregulator-binding transcription factor n=1 Tax=Streptomyces sp. NRRL F-4489 TaxID=1609095 RepID=UPI000749F830|nr:ScbR family autoregulator-binding transcription factor [Streptomyces sp. NRRL F-4489]KUL52334.1 branched-chain amino acid aminotransferase [Streptomyces sp. NRRL F-4489]
MAGRVLKQERAVRTRAALVQAGAEAFAEWGFTRASVARIAERAGLTLGAMYFHFASKEELAREIVRNQPDRVVPAVDSEGLQRAVDTTLTWACRLPDDPVLLAGARLVMDQEYFAGPAGNSHQQWIDVLTADLEEAARRRELRAHADPRAVARLLVYACTGAQMHSGLESGRRDLPRRIAEVWHTLLPAVATPGAARRLELGEERGRPVGT